VKITYKYHSGSDLEVVNAARVSFDKESEWEEKPLVYYADGKYHSRGSYRLKEGDKRLIQFLARGCTSGDWEGLLNQIEERGLTAGYHGDKFARRDLRELVNCVRHMPTHWTPFGQVNVVCHIKCPIFVARQIMKHTVGFVWNEVSRRYVTYDPEFFEPDVWRQAAGNVKQGSSDEPVDNRDIWASYADVEIDPRDINHAAFILYTRMLDVGVCPEQARMVLPQSMYTQMRVNGTLYAWANMYLQRTDPHAQKETRMLVEQLDPIMHEHFPVSWEALTGGRRDDKV